MANRQQWKRSLWGLDPFEVEQVLSEREEPLRRERIILERAISLAESEAGRLSAECRQLEDQIRSARQRLDLVRLGLSRQKSLTSAQNLALRQQIDAMEREHAYRVEEARQREAELRAELARRRQSLHRWVTDLLRSVAARTER